MHKRQASAAIFVDEGEGGTRYFAGINLETLGKAAHERGLPRSQVA